MVGSDDQPAPEELRGRPAGADPDDPYEDVDLSSLPDWWRDAVREFEAHDLRPYRPPRFGDGKLKHEVVDRLERELGIDIEFVGIDVECGDDWTVLVDGGAVGHVERRRLPEGFTEFEMSSAEFEAWIRDRVE
jgi:hypothetical protein